MMKLDEWEYVGYDDFGGRYRTINNINTKENIIDEKGISDDKTAKLIAAAPTMYNALKEIVETMKIKSCFDLSIATNAMEYAE